VPETTIRQVEGEALVDALYPLTRYAFHASPPMGDEEAWKAWMRRLQGVTGFVLFEDGSARGASGASSGAVACCASTAMIQNVRDGLFGMGGIWGVATHPAARRKGYCRRLMARQLAAMREAGRAFSGLYPFRESFYERLGYVSLPQSRRAIFAPIALAPLLQANLGGEVEMMLFGDGFDIYGAYLRRMQQHTHGMAIIAATEMFSTRSNHLWLAVARVGGEVVGIMLYDLRGEREGEFNLRAERFYYRTSQGRYLLLQWIARHIDQANRAELMLAPGELPETWLPDMNVAVETGSLAPMGRVVDVAAIGGMHTGAGRFSARISDPLCPWNEAVWRFEAADGLLQVAPAQESEFDLSIQGLSALVYGSYDPADLPIRGWGAPPASAQERLRARA